MAMQTLRPQEIPSLPIHDSLLVGLTVPGAEDTAITAMEEAWAAHSARWAEAKTKAFAKLPNPKENL